MYVICAIAEILYVRVHVYIHVAIMDYSKPWGCDCVHRSRTLGCVGKVDNYMYKRSLTHRPSSQGWAPKCPIHLCMLVCIILVWCIGYGFLSSLPLRLTLLKSVHVNCDPRSCNQRNDYVTSALRAYLRFAGSATAHCSMRYMYM